MMLNKTLSIIIYVSHFPESPFFAALQMHKQSKYVWERKSKSGS